MFKGRQYVILKLENASTFSQVTVPVSPCVLPLITCTLHPPVTLLPSPAPFVPSEECLSPQKRI